MSGCNESNLSGSDIAKRSLYFMNFVFTDIKACHFASLDDINAKITCCFCITPGHPVMLGNAASRLISCTMNRVTDIFTDINDGHQLLYFRWSKPFAIDAVKRLSL